MAQKIAVIGAGAWGITLAMQAARTHNNVHLWSRQELPNPHTRQLSRLPGISLLPNITVNHDFPTHADFVFLAVPLQYMRSILPHLRPSGPMIACCKGVELTTLKFPLEIIQEFFPQQKTAILSGPNFAKEIALNYPTASVIASRDFSIAQEIAHHFSTPNFRLYSNADPMGVQVGGAAKNVFAIAAGASIGAGLGENARASIITRGIAELTRITLCLGGSADTLSGLAGLGDMILTCTGQSSRNYSLGIELGQGKKLQDILKNRTNVAEGITTAPALLQRARQHHIDTPIIETVTHLLKGKITIQQARSILMGRPLTKE